MLFVYKVYLLRELLSLRENVKTKANGTCQLDNQKHPRNCFSLSRFVNNLLWLVRPLVEFVQKGF